MSRPAHTVETLREAFFRAETLPLKDRRRAARSLGDMACQLEASGALTSADDVELALKALALGVAVHGWPQRYQMARVRLMIARRQQRGGLVDPVVASETAKTLDVEAGGVLVQDADLDFAAAMAATPLHAYLNEKGAYFVNFGGDGTVKVRLRILSDGPCEPAVSELKRLKDAALFGRLASTSGRITVDGGGGKRITARLDKGDWSICAFGLGMGRRPECLLLIGDSDASVAPLHDTPELFM